MSKSATPPPLEGGSEAGTPVAYSYCRFSSPEQSKGDSLRRQTEAATEWCKRNKVHLDTSLTLHDLGRSAYTGQHRKNPDRHALAAFLKAVEGGRVPRGSYLLIENLDRLSREHIRPALTLLLNLIESGIRVAQLTPVEQVYGEEVEPMQLMMAIMELSRGHSESKMKSERVGKAWAQKKVRARKDGELYTRRLPGWIEEAGGKLRLIPSPVRAIQRIFQLAASGYGIVRTVRKLIEEKIPAFGSSGQWNRAYVNLILRDRRVLGEFQPHHPDGKPDGEVIQGYYPPAVSQAEWDAAHAEPRSSLRIRRGKHLELFNGLMRNARDGGRYYYGTRNNRGKRHRVLINASATEGRGMCYSFPLHAFEQAILRCLWEVDPKEITSKADGPDDAMVLTGQLAGVEAELSEATTFMEANGFSPTIGKRVQSLEERKRELAGKLNEARQREAHPLSEAWGEARHLCAALDAAPDKEDARLRLRAALRRSIDSIWLLVANRGTDRLAAVQVWFAGGEKFRNYRILYRSPRGNRHGKRTPGRIWVESIRYPVTPGVIDFRKREDAEWALEDLLAWNPERDAEEGGRFLLKGKIVESHD